MPDIVPMKDQLAAVRKFREVDAALIGDEMGVGKTVTAIERDFMLRKDHPKDAAAPTLIVCKKIGLDVWLFHLKAMGVMEGEILVLDPKDRATFVKALSTLREDLFAKQPAEYTYYLMHYDAILLMPELLGRPHPIRWFNIIADEAHYIKNPKAQRTKLFKKILCRYKTGVTGTPADDKPTDFWSILHWLYPRKYTSYWAFYNKFIEFEEKERHDFYVDASGKRRMKVTGYREIVGVKNIGRLHREIEPFYVRRMLLDVEPDMPEKIHVEPPIMVDMSPAQRRAYDQMRKKSMARIEDMDGEKFVTLAPDVITVVLRLQQMALATLKGVRYEDEDFEVEECPILIFSKPSPKLDAVMDMITDNEDEPFVIFTWFHGMADLIEEECKAKKISVVKIHGGVTSHRGELVRRFQEGEARIFVGTIASVGESITLTRAHHAIFTDRSWNPQRNRQAEARLWRRTQRNAVRIYTIETRDSIDQIRAEKITSKADLVDAINNPGRYQ